IDGIEEKIAIVLQANPLIFGETGIADYNQAGGLISLRAIGGDTQGKRAGSLGIEPNFPHEFRNRETAGRRFEQLDGDGIALGLVGNCDSAGKLQKGHAALQLFCDGTLAIINHQRCFRAGPEQAADTTGVNHDVRADVDVPGVENVIELRIGLRIDFDQRFAAIVQILSDHDRFLNEERLLRPRNHGYVARWRHAILRDQVDGLCVVALSLESLIHIRIALRAIVGEGFFVVAGNETDRLDLVARYLEDRTGYILLGKVSVSAGFERLFSGT